ncbi:hypothetical protein PAECIP111802_04893 [Paenibacillus allorhizosphaerae]|uniref:Uncharacterized protein n=1 Tax=Paenibacillus allorhizosphaerae TaxID=2849866 RepID=A0ABM8VN92_9BACL|nr:hypothetical protein PAECIP111802_04893 [Paenibacillus allorhizosphaerae]
MSCAIDDNQIPERSFQVISIVTEQQHQLNMTKQGRLSSMNDPEMKRSFAEALLEPKQLWLLDKEW